MKNSKINILIITIIIIISIFPIIEIYKINKNANIECIKIQNKNPDHKSVSNLIISLDTIIDLLNDYKGIGSIWTTRDDCGNEQQDVNHYCPGEVVYINGKNFNSNTEYEWYIKVNRIYRKKKIKLKRKNNTRNK